MNNPRYNYLYDSDNVLVYHSNAIRGGDYKMYIDDKEYLFTYKSGDERQYFVSKKTPTNPFAKISVVGGGGETDDHYNAKMQIVYELKYFDTIFNQEVIFDKVVAEKYYPDQMKRPDLSCYQDGKLVACIEILNTSRKSENDIEKLKELDCLIIEIDINNENRCSHIAFPKVFERKRSEINEVESRVDKLESEYRESKRNFQQRLSEIRSGYEGYSKGLEGLQSEITGIEEQIEAGATLRVKEINEWLQKRLPNDLRKQYENRGLEEGIAELRSRISELAERNSPELRSRIKETPIIKAEVERLEGRVRFITTRIGHKNTIIQRGY